MRREVGRLNTQITLHSALISDTSVPYINCKNIENGRKEFPHPSGMGLISIVE
jgi:hypothetical protein